MVNCPHDKTINCEFELTMRTPITDNTCAAIPVLNKSGERINEDAIKSNLPMPESQLGDHHASAVENKSVRQNTRIEAVAKQLNNGGRSFFCCTANPFQTLFNTDHALLLRQRRFLVPPKFRRFSGGNAGESPTAIRQDTRRNVGNNAGVNPPVHPVKSPGNFRAIARLISGIFPPQCWQTAAGITGAIAGHFPVIFPAYARH